MTPDERIARARADLIEAQKDILQLAAQERGRRRGPLVRRLHEVRGMLDPLYAYTSQAGQDFVVDRLLQGRRDGVFVDVGGYDGVTGSNTLFLEQWRGWTGVLVEPVPAQRARAAAIRRCPCLGYAVAATDGDADFIEISEGFTQMSGLSGTYDPGLLTQVRADPRHAETVFKVETRTLSRILVEAGTPHPDFVSLDIEGGEEAVLRGFPFAQHRVGIWAIENNSGGPGISDIMRASGHELVEYCGPDEIWRFKGASP